MVGEPIRDSMAALDSYQDYIENDSNTMISIRSSRNICENPIWPRCGIRPVRGPSAKVKALRFRLMTNLIYVEAATSVNWR